jgi:hypothetical protein
MEEKGSENLASSFPRTPLKDSQRLDGKTPRQAWWLSRNYAMKDGNFIMLSVDSDTVKVLVGSQLEAIESFTELLSFPVNQSQKSRRQQRTAILNDLKQQLGFPASVSELRDKLQGFLPPAA